MKGFLMPVWANRQAQDIKKHHPLEILKMEQRSNVSTCFNYSPPKIFDDFFFVFFGVLIGLHILVFQTRSYLSCLLDSGRVIHIAGNRLPLSSTDIVIDEVVPVCRNVLVTHLCSLARAQSIARVCVPQHCHACVLQAGHACRLIFLSSQCECSLLSTLAKLNAQPLIPYNLTCTNTEFTFYFLFFPRVRKANTRVVFLSVKKHESTNSNASNDTPKKEAQMCTLESVR